MEDSNAYVASGLLTLGGAIVAMFGFLWLCRPPESRRDDYSDVLVGIARVMVPVGIVIMAIGFVAWLRDW